MTSLADLKVTDFEARKGETFRLRTPKAALDLELVEISRLGNSGRDGGAFSLVFRTPPGPFLPQAIYPVDHAAFGTLEVFVVPLGPIAGTNAYEVIFT